MSGFAAATAARSSSSTREPPMDPVDLVVRDMSGPEPVFDDVTAAFLCNSRDEFVARCRLGGLLEDADLGKNAPWLWRVQFRARGLVREDEGEPRPVERHVVAVRFLPDYLRRADRFEMLALMEPKQAFHPNLAPPAICVQVRPGETLLELAESLHALVSWRVWAAGGGRRPDQRGRAVGAGEPAQGS